MILLSLYNLFENDASDCQPVAIRNGVSIPFEQFRKDVTSYTAQCKPSSKAALICNDSYNFTVGLFGLLHSGCEVVLPPNSQPNTLQVLQNEFDFLVTDETIKNLPPSNKVLPPIDPLQYNLHFFTSGSTGTSKCISKNIAVLESEIKTLNSLFTMAKGTVFATVPHHHIYGLTFKILWPLVTNRPFDTETHGPWETLLSNLTSNSTIVSSPAHLSRLSGIKNTSNRPTPSKVFSAGAALPFNAISEIEEILNVIPNEIFGSTETGAIATRHQINENQPWKALPGISLRLNEENCMELLSPHVGPEWFATQDMIDITKDGFYFLGRADSIVKIEGKRVSLINVENTLNQLPFVKEAAVLLLPNDKLAAVIVPSAEGNIQLSALGNFRFNRLLRKNLASSLETSEMPKLWRFVDQLPTQGIGKRPITELRALFGGK